MIALVAPALLAALIVVETVGAPEGGAYELDARVVGVGVAAIALRFGAHDAPGGRAGGARNGPRTADRLIGLPQRTRARPIFVREGVAARSTVRIASSRLDAARGCTQWSS